MKRYEIEALIEAMLIQERYDGIRPTEQAFGDEALDIQNQLNEDVKQIIDNTKDILMERGQL